MFSEKALNLEEHELRETARALPPPLKHQYQLLEQRHLKRPSTYRALNWVFPTGIHHFYLRRWLRGLITLSLTLGGLYLVYASQTSAFGLMVLMVVVVIEIPQLLNARHLVHSCNNRIMAQCLEQVQRAHQAPQQEPAR